MCERGGGGRESKSCFSYCLYMYDYNNVQPRTQAQSSGERAWFPLCVISLLLPSIGPRYEAKSRSDLCQRCVLFVCEVPGQQLHTVDSSLPSQDVGGVIFSHAHHCTKQFHQSSILSTHTHTHTHPPIANLES